MVEVIYEDNHILVCVKPQNVPSQSDSSGDMDMLSMVKDYIKQKYNKPGNVYVGLVHRLDRVTGGLMVFAKTSKAAKRLSEEIALHEMNKRYLAVCHGELKDNSGKLVNFLKKDASKNIVTVVSKSAVNAKRAELDYTVVAKKDQLSLVEIALHTGRSHQIRVQLSYAGAPLYGDHKYNDAKAGNLALWAYKLSFVHPTKKEKMTFIYYPPNEKPWNYFEKEINNIK